MVSTKATTVIQLFLANAILIVLFSLVDQDMSSRIGYAQSIGFTPSVNYSPLTFVLSSVGRGTSIPGLPTVDWSQIFLIVLIIIDGSFLLERLLRRSRTN